MLPAFKQYLSTLKLSPVSRKLYGSDVQKFLYWLQASKAPSEAPPWRGEVGSITLTQVSSSATYSKYLASLRSSATAPSMLKRTTASLRQFGTFLSLTYNLPNPALSPLRSTIHDLPSNLDYLTHFTNYLTSDHLSPLTIKSYKSDITRYLDWANKQLPRTEIREVLSDKNIKKYLNHLLQSGSIISSTIDRKEQSLTRFQTWYTTVYSPNHVTDSSIHSRSEGLPLSPHSRSEGLPHSGSVNSRIPWFPSTTYNLRSIISLAVLLLFIATLAVFAYRQFSRDATLTSAYPSTAVTPNRQLSFQGRLENAAGTPITTATDFVFKLFTASSGGTELYSTGTCSITPDTDGVFNTQIGSTCGSAITSSVFTENAGVWLEVTVVAETLAPRQQIATVAYALNAETLQGFPLSATISAIRSTIVPMNQYGEIIVGEQSPRLTGVSGTFQISAPALSIITATGTNGNITLAPDGTGQVNLNGNTTSTNFFNVSNAQLTTGSLITGTAANANTGFKLLDLLSGVSPTSKFSVTDTGLTTIGADLYLNSGLSTFGTAVTDGTLEATKFCTGDGETNCATDFSSYATGTNYWTRTSGNVSPLNLNDTISATTSAAVALTLTQTGAFDAFLVQDAAGDTTPFVIDQSGNVGIGTTGPGAKLEVKGNIYVGGTTTNLYFKPDQVAAGALLGGNWIESRNGSASLVLFGNADGEAGTGIQIPYYNGTSWQSGLELKNTASGYGNLVLMQSGGNVGIGTTGPGYKLDVNGAIRIQGTNGGTFSNTSNALDLYSTGGLYRIGFDSQGATKGYIRYNVVADSATDTWGHAIGHSLTATPNTLVTDMFVGASGNVGIGTTSPTSKLHVEGAVTGKALAIFNETGDQNILTASQSGIPVFNLARVAGTAANGTTFTPSATGNVVTQAATGSDTNIAFSLDSKGSGALNLNGTATGDVNLAGGYGGTGCTITNSNGNLSCNGTITGTFAGTLPWSSLVAPTANLSLAHAGYTTAFTFNSVTTADAFALSSSSLTTGTILDLSSTSTAGGASGLSKVLDITRSGTNANASHTAYGLYSAVTNTGTTSTNVGGYFSASGATNNYGLIVENGNVGIGTTGPGQKLDVSGYIKGNDIIINNNHAWSGQANTDPSTQGSLRFITTHTGAGNEYTYQRITPSSYGYAIVSGDNLEFDIYCSTANPSSVCDAGIEIDNTDATNGRSLGITDQNSISVYAGNKSSYALGRWYHVKASLVNLVGKTINYVSVVDESDTDGSYTNYYRKIVITNGTTTKNIVWDGGVPQANTIGYGSGNSSTDVSGSYYDEIYVAGSGSNYFAGNVGIGTTGPQGKLDILGPSDSVLGGRVILTDDGGFNPQIKTYRWTGTASSYYPFHLVNNGGDMQFQSGGATTLGAETLTTKMVIQAAGNVGIGTTGPGELLDIAATTDAAGVAGPKIRFTKGATNKGVIGIGGNYLGVATNTDDMVFRNDAGNMLFGFSGAEKVRFTSGGNVGIGTTGPAQKLHVYGSGTASQILIDTSSGSFDPSLALTTAGATNEGLKLWYDANVGDVYFDSVYNSTAGDIHFRTKTAGTPVEALFIESAGNVGIGTTGPGAKLDVRGDARINTDAGFYATTGNPLYFGVDASPTNVGAIVPYGNNDTTYGLTFNTYTGSALTEKVRIQGNGNVGIGTTGPNEKLEIKGNIRVAGASPAFEEDKYVYFGPGTTFGVGQTFVSGAPNKYYTDILYSGGTDTDRAFRVMHGTTEQFRVQANGNVGIGTTGPSGKLQIVGDNPLILQRGTGSQGKNSGILFKDEAGTTNAGAIGTEGVSTNDLQIMAGTYGTGSGIRFYTNSDLVSTNERMRIDKTGNVGIGTTGPTALLTLAANSTFGWINGNSYTWGFSKSANDLHIGQTSSTVGFSSLTDAITLLGGASPTVALVPTSGNVGIGTTAPGAKLEVHNDNASTVLDRLTTTYGTMGDYIGFASPSVGAQTADLAYLKWTRDSSQGRKFSVVTSNTAGVSTEGFTVDNSGNVGIGTTGPGAKLDVAGQVRTDASGVTINSGLGYNLGGLSSPAAQTLIVGGANLNTVNIFNGSAVGMTLNSSGNVGIGTTGPSQLLDVGSEFLVTSAGKVRIGGTTAPTRRLEIKGVTGAVNSGIALLEGNGNLRATMAVDTTTDDLLLASTGTIHIYSGSTIGNVTTLPTNERVAITTTGNVGIGTTSPLAKLHVVGSCVTGDTLLPIRRRRRRKSDGLELEEDDDPLWDYLLCRIDEILPGDEVLSLNEFTGAMEYARINALKDMDIKEVYELTTKSGRVIRTTENHPYLTLSENNPIENEEKLNI